MKKQVIQRIETIDLVNGKKVFFDYEGNLFSINREVPEYRHYNVPKDVEDVWKQTIVNNLLEEIKKTKGYEKSSKVTKLIAIYGHYNNIQLLEELLDDNTLDTFSKILYLEGLNREKLGVNISIKYKILKIDDPKLYIEALNEKISNYKSILLNTPITIDESFKQNYALKYYDFSDENIIRRIENI